jgi:hypothetical protein
MGLIYRNIYITYYMEMAESKEIKNPEIKENIVRFKCNRCPYQWVFQDFIPKGLIFNCKFCNSVICFRCIKVMEPNEHCNKCEKEEIKNKDII